MKLLITFFIVIIGSFPLMAEEKPTREEALEYLKVTGALEKLDDYASAYTEISRIEIEKGETNYDEALLTSPAYLKLLNTYKEKLKDGWVTIIRENFTGQELRSLTEFMSREETQKHLKRIQELGPNYNEVHVNLNSWLNDEFWQLAEKHRK